MRGRLEFVDVSLGEGSLEEIEFAIVDHSIYMHLRTSRKVFESEIYARLIGRMLGIIYWVINVIYLMRESFVIVGYYFRYLLSQNASTTEQTHMVETVLSYLVVAVVTIFVALESVVLLCKTFHQEKSLLTPHNCAHCQDRKWQKIKLNQAVHVDTAWLKHM